MSQAPGWSSSPLDPGDPTALDPGSLPFPNNVLVLLWQEFGGDPANAIEGIEFTALRPLQPTDPDTSLGFFAMDWVPGELEMTGRPNSDPTISTYLIGIHAFVRHTNREEGLLKHALLSKLVRSMLYRRESLHVRLQQLKEESFGIHERFQRSGVRQQRFMANEIEGNFVYLSTIEFWVETETV